MQSHKIDDVKLIEINSCPSDVVAMREGSSASATDLRLFD